MSLIQDLGARLRAGSDALPTAQVATAIERLRAATEQLMRVRQASVDPLGVPQLGRATEHAERAAYALRLAQEHIERYLAGIGLSQDAAGGARPDAGDPTTGEPTRPRRAAARRDDRPAGPRRPEPTPRHEDRVAARDGRPGGGRDRPGAGTAEPADRPGPRRAGPGAPPRPRTGGWAGDPPGRPAGGHRPVGPPGDQPPAARRGEHPPAGPGRAHPPAGPSGERPPAAAPPGHRPASPGIGDPVPAPRDGTGSGSSRAGGWSDIPPGRWWAARVTELTGGAPRDVAAAGATAATQAPELLQRVAAGVRAGDRERLRRELTAVPVPVGLALSGLAQPVLRRLAGELLGREPGPADLPRLSRDTGGPTHALLPGLSPGVVDTLLARVCRVPTTGAQPGRRPHPADPAVAAAVLAGVLLQLLGRDPQAPPPTARVGGGDG